MNFSQMDALLDAMRFREELDIRDRQRRRLMKAKTKVSGLNVTFFFELNPIQFVLLL